MCMAFTAFASCSDDNNDAPKKELPVSADTQTEPEIGETMPKWTEGNLEIHSISTGRGESNFYILPDGTTMLVDAAGSLVTQAICDRLGVGGVTPPRPDASVSATDVSLRYIRHFNPRGLYVDYFVNSHFHEDHMGSWPEKYPEFPVITKHPVGNFYVNGLAGLGSTLIFEKIIDRGYTLPVTLATSDRMRDYLRFLKWTMDTNGTVYETAKVGHEDQIVLKYNPSAYPGFNIRILYASGYAWTGTGSETVRTIPLKASEISGGNPDGNIYSIAMMLSFNKFNLYTAGDLQWEAPAGMDWQNQEAPIVSVVNKVEVMKGSHHGSTNANSTELVNKLRPDVLWVNPWRTEQPGIPAIRRFVAANPDIDIFSTNIAEGSREPLAEAADRFRSWNGHIVFRVRPDGDYMVYVLDDSNEDYRVKAIFGPYKSN